MENLNNLPPFYPGQKIVCISDGDWQNMITLEWERTPPYKNDICQVINCYIGFDGRWYCNLVGFSNMSIDNGQDGYDCSDFKPLLEQKFPLIKLTRIIEKELVSAN